MPMLKTRARAGPVAGAVLSLLLAATLVPIATAERWLGLTVVEDGAAPITVRGLVARGDFVDADRADALRDLLTRPAPTTLLGLGVAFALIGLLLVAYLRSTQRGRLLRVQLAVLGLLVFHAATVKAALLLTALPPYLVPTAAGALLGAVVIDRATGFGLAIALSLVTATLLPFDSSLAIVLGAQGLGAVLALGRPKKRRAFFIAGMVGGVASVAAYIATSYLYGRAHADPNLIAAVAGGLVSAPLALLARPFVERLAGDIPRHRLMELADLENPLLKKIAAEAPGTWQHSLAMANMAEIAANAIGANALLVRVGAYYHDLGKSLQPQYYIENLAGGQRSPHDDLPPEMSADAIFSHVTEGVRLARANRLPEAVIDFMHMHHGDGVLEYFWGKCVEEGNPRCLTPEAFRYPGVKPQSRETAILAIVDAVEASSRTLRRPDSRAIEQLVQRIVYGKLHLGQLDESGLSVAELRKLSNTLVETLKHAHHVRIEYPWQREERAAQLAETVPLVAAMPSGRYVLDSADGPAKPAKG